MILLDTHVLVWLAEDRADLGSRAAAAADDALGRDELLVSAISFWEIAMLAQKKRLELELEPAEFRRATLSLGIREIAVSGDIGVLATGLARFHGAPADRIILATSLATNAALVTADRAMLRWRGPGRRIPARR